MTMQKNPTRSGFSATPTLRLRRRGIWRFKQPSLPDAAGWEFQTPRAPAIAPPCFPVFKRRRYDGAYLLPGEVTKNQSIIGL